MDTLGTDFNNTGSVMARAQLEELRQKRGECLTCGRKCFRKKLFKMIPITEDGLVLEGRCLHCIPLTADEGGSPSALPRRATPQDLERFTRSQSNLSSRNLLSGSAASSPMVTTRRHHMKRAASSLPRSDNCNVESSPTSSRANSQKNLRRVTSMSPVIGTQEQRQGAGSLSPPPSRRAIANLNSTGGGDGSAQSGRSGAVAGTHEDFGSLTELPEMSWGSPSGQQQAALRRSSHSHAINGGSGGPSGTPRATRKVPPKSKSGDFITHDELERAHRTILAAQQQGFMYDDDIIYGREETAGLNDQSGHKNNYYGSSSGRSLRSGGGGGGGTLGDVLDPPDEIDGYVVPRHGVLNRGGTFEFQPRTNGRIAGVGSARSFSSMQSMEEWVHSPRTQISSRDIRAADVEFMDENERHSDRRHQDATPLEQEYLESLRRVGQNYGEILVIVREAVDSTLVVSSCLEQLARLKLAPDDQDMLGEMGAPLIIADLMHSHPASLDIQLAACGATWNMSGTTQNQIAFADAAALDMILAAMDRFVDNVELQEKAIATLSNLGAVAQNISILDEKRAITKIVKAMNKHSEVSSLQIKGCGAVTNLASHDLPMKQRIVECGAGGAVVVAMVMHPNDHYLQEKALRALRNLCANSDTNKVEIANLGGIDSVVSAMQLHRDEAGVQQEGAWTLSNLAGNKGNKAVIGDCGGVDVVVRAMWVHSDNLGVQEWCCRALFTLTLDPKNGDVVLEVGGISAIVNAMQGHVDSATVQEMGCAVLGNLAGTDKARMRIVDDEALDAIVLAMVLHTDDIQVQERACIVLTRLAIDSNVNAMKAANIPELVQTAARKFPDTCDEPANHILSALGGTY